MRAPNPAALIADLESTGMSRRAIARATGLSPSYITLLAKGDRGQHIGHAAMAGLQRVVQGRGDSTSVSTDPQDSLGNR